MHSMLMQVACSPQTSPSGCPVPSNKRVSRSCTQDCVLADGSVRCNAEVTILAAFCFWAGSGQAGDEPRRDAAANVEAICSRIRLPEIPPGLLHCYWAQFSFLRRFDPGQHILLRAVRMWLGLSALTAGRGVCAAWHSWDPFMCSATLTYTCNASHNFFVMWLWPRFLRRSLQLLSHPCSARGRKLQRETMEAMRTRTRRAQV